MPDTRVFIDGCRVFSLLGDGTVRMFRTEVPFPPSARLKKAAIRLAEIGEGDELPLRVPAGCTEPEFWKAIQRAALEEQERLGIEA
jgi:hypothetical protein